jgi:hypothetical protein
MIVAIGTDLYWHCESCYDLIGRDGLALHSRSMARGVFPAVRTVCSERCAERLAATLVQPVRRLRWETFLGMLTEGRGIA